MNTARKSKNGSRKAKHTAKFLQTGISGLDDILGGGLPQNKIIMLVGRPGCGKSVFSLEFILRGIEKFNQNGVYCTFEETTDDLYSNAASFGWDLTKLEKQKKIHISSFDIQPDKNIEVGDFNLEGVFLRIQTALNKVGAKRLVLDGLNNLIAGFSNEKLVRMEVIRLFRWLKEKDITVMVTGERGVDTWTKYGFEEYLCDGLILLSNTADENFITRHLRVIKCRGINHGTDVYPFLIGNNGIEIFPILNADFNYEITEGEYISSGNKDIDALLDTGGFIKGSTVLVTGTSGTGKSTLAASFISGVCGKNQKAVYFAFEESSDQIIRNMRSVGLDLMKWVDKGKLSIHATRSTISGLEGHLVTIKNIVQEHRPSVVVIDPITAFRPVAPVNQIKLMLIRINDFLRSKGITTLMTSLSNNSSKDELSDIPMSSLADTWISLSIQEYKNEKYNLLEVQKSRGMNHNKQRHELVFGNDGIHLEELYLGPNGLLAGSAKVWQQIEDEKKQLKIKQELEKLKTLINLKKEVLQNKIQEVEFNGLSEIRELETRHSTLREQAKLEDELDKQLESLMNMESGD